MDSELSDVVKYGSYICLSHELKFLSSPGFLDNHLQLSKTDSLKSVFRILPTCTYSTQDFLLSSVNSQDFFTKFQSRKINLEGEISTNIITSLSYKNQPITFGSLIQLQHVYSSKFLTISYDKHKNKAEKFEIILQDFGSEMSIFCIQSAFKYQEEGTILVKTAAKIRIGIAIRDLDKMIYLNYDKSIKEIVGSIGKGLAFGIVPYNLYNVENQDVCCGEFFQIIHSEENSCMTGVKSSFDKNIVEVKFSANLQNSNGVWYMENLNNYEGGPLNTESVYTIKHLGCNKYLCAEAFNTGYRLVFGEKSSSAVWRIVQNGRREKVISEEFYKIVNEQTKLALSAEIDFEVTGQEHYFPSLSYDYSNISYFRLKKCPPHFACGVVFLVTCQEFVANFIDQVKTYMDKRFEDLSIIVKQFSLMNICLEQIESFCYNRLKKMISENVLTGDIDPTKQNTLRDLKFISSLTEILSFFARRKNSSMMKKENFTALKYEIEQLCTGIFKTFKVICIDNIENQEEAFENVNVYCKYIEQSVGANEFLLSLLRNNERLLYKFSSYLSNERTVIISSYIHSLRKKNSINPDELLDLLSSLCTCKSEAINANQEIIHEFLFKNPENFSKITIPVSTENGLNIDLTLPHPLLSGEHIIQLDDCCEDISLYEDKIKYFTKLILLFASMCSGKNYLNASTVGVWFSGRCLMFNLWNEKLSPALRASFGRLFTSIYIDCFAKIEEKRIGSIKVFNFGYGLLKFTKKFVRMQSENDVTDLYLNATEIKDKYYIENTDEFTLHGLKEDILCYFSNFRNKEYDELTLELLSIAYKLTKFEIFGPTVYDFDKKKLATDKDDINFKLEDTSIYRFLNMIQNVLFSEIDRKNYHNLTSAYKTIRDEDSEKKTKAKLLNKILETNKKDLKFEPAAIESQHLLNYLNSVSINEDNMAVISDSQIECKLEILRIMELIQDWRQDSLVNNIISWFKDIVYRNAPIMPEELYKLLPSIIDVDHYEIETHYFNKVCDDEILDLAWLGKDIIKNLLKLFCITNNYTMQNMILKIVMKCFSQRKNLIKSIYRLSLVTAKEDSDIYNWMKIGLALFSELSDQSEIWISYYKNPINYARHFKKFQKVLKILELVQAAVYKNSFIQAGTVVKVSTQDFISKTRQNLIVKLGFHKKIILFIKDSIHHLEKIYDDPKTEQENPRENMIELFSSCFKVLAKLVYKNKQNQKVIFFNLQDFMKDLRMDLCQMELIVEIFRDNYELCLMMNEKILSQFIALIENEGRQARFLELFPVVQIANNEPIQDLQKIVFKVLAENINHKYLLYLDQNGSFTYETSKTHVNPNYNDQPVLYHCKILEILYISSIGTKNIYLIEAKCQKLFPIRMIFEALKFAEHKYSNTASMRMPLLKLFYYAYIESEKICEELMMNLYFIEYIKKHSQNMDQPIEFLDVMVWIFYEYCQKYLKNDRFVYETYDDYDAIDMFLRNLLGSSQIKKLSVKTLNDLAKLKVFFNIESEVTEKLMQESEPMVKSDQEKDEVKLQWEAFKAYFVHTNLLKSKLKAEKQALLTIIIHIKDYLEEISFKKFLTKLVNFMRQALSKHPPVEVLINCINFIVKILSKAFKSSKKKISKDEVQNLLCNLGLVKIILSIMCDKSTNKKVFNRLVLLSIEMLDDGNSKVQEAYYTYFTSSEMSEIFFKNLFTQLSSKGHLVSQGVPEQDTTKLLVYKKQKHNCLKILRLLQLLCENHYLPLQNYLRFQEKSNNNFNIIEVTVSLFRKLVNTRKYSSFLILSQCLDTLTEMIQGPCEGNQKELISLKFLDISIDLLSIDQHQMPSENDPGQTSQREFNTESSQDMDESLLKGWMIVHLKYKLSIALISLLELNKDNYIISFMARTIPQSIFHNNLMWLFSDFLGYYDCDEYKENLFNNMKDNEKFKYGKKCTECSDNDSFGKLVGDDKKIRFRMCITELGFNLYHLIRYLEDYEKGLKNVVDETKEKKRKIWDLIRKTEVVVDVYKLFLEIYKNMIVMLKITKKRLVLSNEEILEKALDFFDQHSGRIEIVLEDGRIISIYFALQPESLYLTDEIKANFHNTVDRSSEKSKLQYLQMEIPDLKLEIRNVQRLEQFFRKNPFAFLITSNVRLLYNLGFFLTLWLNIMLILSYHNPYSGFEPQFCLKTNIIGDCMQSLSSNSTSTLFQLIGLIHLLCSIIVLILQILKSYPKLYTNNMKLFYNEEKKKIYRFFGKGLSIILALFISKTIYHFLYTVFSFAAIASGKYFIFCVHTVDVIYRYQSLRDVVKSIYYSKKTLVITFIFIIVIVYYFVLWGYSRLIVYFGDDCPNLYTCMIFTYDRGLKLGMGWVLKSWDKGTFNMERVFYDNFFLFVILIMMMNFIKGIIFDAFFVLRDETDRNDWDRKHRCFICGLEREEYENLTKKSFDGHVAKEHNEWNYVLYIMYLSDKDRTELTSVESYMRNCLDNNSILWYPQKTAISIQKLEEEQDSQD